MQYKTYSATINSMTKKMDDLKKINLELTRELMVRSRERDFYKEKLEELLNQDEN